MKPLLILKINVGQENGGVIPLKIYQNDEAYFNKITDSLFELFPTINTGSQIKKVLIDQIKEGIQEAMIEKEKRKEKRQQQKVSKQENQQKTFEQRTFDSIMKKESSDNDQQAIDDQQFNTFCVNSLNNHQYDNQQLQQQNMTIKQDNFMQNLANQDHNNLKINQHTQSQHHDQLSNRTFDVDKKYNHHQTYTIAVNSALYSPMILEQRQFEEEQEIDQELQQIQNNQLNHQGIQVFRVEQQHVNFNHGQAQYMQNSMDSVNLFKVNKQKHSKSNSLNLSSYKPFQQQSELKLNDKDVLNYNLPFSPNASTLNPTTNKTTINNTNRGSPTNLTQEPQITTTFNNDFGIKMEIQITEDSDNTISTSNICSAKSQIPNSNRYTTKL
eukprot:403334383